MLKVLTHFLSTIFNLKIIIISEDAINEALGTLTVNKQERLMTWSEFVSFVLIT
jgi:hypothetical protein